MNRNQNIDERSRVIVEIIFVDVVERYFMKMVVVGSVDDGVIFDKSM